MSSGEYVWKSSFENGIWTYDLKEALEGVKTAVTGVGNAGDVVCMGVSGMMHGLLAFDREWNLLTPFRTWQNTITAEAAKILTDLFGFNIPQRWSIAHLYQAILNGEEYVPKIAHITTLSGYIHFLLTGENVIGAGDGSGIFPIDCETKNYNAEMLRRFDVLAAEHGMPRTAEELLPRVLPAGEIAGRLTREGSLLLGGGVKPGTPLAPPEGDVDTGIVATGAVAPRTGSVSGGTSVVASVILERPLTKVRPEINIVTTPSLHGVAMVQANNGTNDSNAWVSLLKEAAELFGAPVKDGDAYTALYRLALEGERDCGGVLVCNYMAGEGVVHLDSGIPMLIRRPGAHFTLPNMFRAVLYSCMATLRIGLDILADEHVKIDTLTGHGGFFKTPVVGQRLMAAACGVPITCRVSAGEGGPYGMALLAAYTCVKNQGETLESFLTDKVFAGSESTVITPDPDDAAGFGAYMESYRRLLEVERKATEVF